jgi:hypothetical protein
MMEAARWLVTFVSAGTGIGGLCVDYLQFRTQFLRFLRVPGPRIAAAQPNRRTDRRWC